LGYRNTKNRGKPRQQDLESLIIFPAAEIGVEEPDIWPDFHVSFTVKISQTLNQTLPNPYYALIGERPAIGTEEEGRRYPFVEIRDSARGHKLITLIEILSPSNKRPGPDREAYRRKQSEVLESDASLIELDLLRTGERIIPDVELGAFLHQIDPPPYYLVLVNRAWRRNGATAYQVFARGLREWLPCIPVPLKQGEPEVPLDLQYVLNQAYDGGPYRRGAVDYSQPPRSPLPEPGASWAAQWLREPAQDEPPPA
jgi:hypothetical protein